MESFFQAAFNSVMEAAGGGSRTSRGSSSSSRGGGDATTSRSNTSTGSSGGGTWRMNRFSSRSAPERAASSPGQSGAPSPTMPSGAPQSASSDTANAPSDQSGNGHATNSARERVKPNSSRSNPRTAPGSRGNTSTSARAEGSGSKGCGSGGKTGDAPVCDRQAADRLKDLGNESFRRGMYGLAVEYYSKAIAADATVASYFTNRALCHKRENRYAEALQDAEAALALEEMNVKGLYIKGDALVQLGDLDSGVNLLEKAEKASSSGTARAAHEIRHSLLSAKKLRYERYQKQRSADRKDLEAFLRECIAIAVHQGKVSNDEVKSRLEQLEHLVAEAEEANAPFELPDFLTCRISMGLMDEPVVSPSGITYERRLLLEHFNRNGPIEPLTRQPCEKNNLIPNYALKEASAWFLERAITSMRLVGQQPQRTHLLVALQSKLVTYHSWPQDICNGRRELAISERPR